MRGPWHEVGQDVVQRLGTGHDQRAVPHDAQVPDDLPQVFAHGGDVECGVVDPGLLHRRDWPA